MEKSVILMVLTLVGVCQCSLNFKSVLHNVLPQVKKIVEKNVDLKNVKLSDLHIPVKGKDLEELKPVIRKIQKGLPADLQHLDSNLQDSVSDLQGSTKEIRKQLQTVLKGLEGEVLKNLKLKGLGGCVCSSHACSCCEHLKIDEFKLDSTVCVGVAYLPKDIGVDFTLTVDGKTFINETISAANPPPVCVGIPTLAKYASVCIRFTDLHVDRDNKKFSGCLSFEAKLESVKVVDEEIGCFNMPIPAADYSTQLEGNTTKNSTQVSKEDKLKMLSRLGLMGKTYSKGRLINNNLLHN
ncbi:uncharacterized protein LOC132547250 [Ylistrum balloti]|uniref:uncharacterized protein LOC132547250 n=1 Tax=Ylistrum balloti TaxID=509963 RepID=UPI0029058E90|nr:uncharacterized protein LOC132547250 [Ylistrum balloti]